MFYKATLTLCLMAVGLAAVLPTEERRFRQFRQFGNDTQESSNSTVTTHQPPHDNTTEPGSDDNATTVGICNRNSNTFYLYGAKTFSVYSNDADLSTDNAAAPEYENNQYCYLNIYNMDSHPRLKVEVTINSENNFDTLSVYSGEYSGSFTGPGYNRTTIVVPSSYVSLVWSTDSSVTYPLGFSLRVSGTYDEPSYPDLPVNQDNFTTVGICNRTTTDSFYLYGAKTFSVYSNDADLSTDNAAAPEYGNNQYCYVYIINTNSNQRIKLEIRTLSENNIDTLTVSGSGYYETFSGISSHTVVLPISFLSVSWSTDGSVTYPLGFSLKVSGINYETTVPGNTNWTSTYEPPHENVTFTELKH